MFVVLLQVFLIWFGFLLDTEYCKEPIDVASSGSPKTIHQLDPRVAISPDQLAMHLSYILLSLVASCVAFAVFSLSSLLFCRACFGCPFTILCVYMPLLLILVTLSLREYLSGVPHSQVTVCCLQSSRHNITPYVAM
jgi:hypothetical protein